MSWRAFFKLDREMDKDNKEQSKLHKKINNLKEKCEVYKLALENRKKQLTRNSQFNEIFKKEYPIEYEKVKNIYLKREVTNN